MSLIISKANALWINRVWLTHVEFGFNLQLWGCFIQNSRHVGKAKGKNIGPVVIAAPGPLTLSIIESGVVSLV